MNLNFGGGGLGLQMPTGYQSPVMGLNQNMAGAGFQPQGLNFYNPSAGVNNNAPQIGGIGFNLPTAQLGLQGLGSLANIFAAFQAQGLAKKQFDFSKNIANTNLDNQVKSYNTALTDRITSRAKAQGMTDDEVANYLSENRLSR